MEKNKKIEKKENYIYDIEQTVYGHMFMNKNTIIVSTLGGLRTARGHVGFIEAFKPAGFWFVPEGTESKERIGRIFIPFHAVDHIEVVE